MKRWILLFILGLVTYYALRHTLLTTQLMPPDVRLPDNSTYTGELKDGVFHGQGELKSADGSQYVGEFKNGLMHGKGELTEPNGTLHKGLYQDGLMHGKGHIKFADGGYYFGEFYQNSITGEGMMIDVMGTQYEGLFEFGLLVEGTSKDKDGNVQEGSFSKGLLDGPGTYATADGYVYKGEFVAGILQGKGQIFHEYGDHYEGEIEDWVYKGQGELLDSNGDRYIGAFDYGMFHGEGVLTLAEPIDGVNEVSGEWEYGYHPDDPRELSPGPYQTKAVDDLLYNQNRLLEQQLAGLKNHEIPGINLYFLGASLHRESVFYRELDFIETLMMDHFDAQGKTLTLYNNPVKSDEKPLATETAIKQSLAGLATHMDVNNDVLFLYLTSHGKPDELSVSYPGLNLADIEAKGLQDILQASPIRWKVIMISACYSGSFIEELSSPDHLIMTAAREDRVSFGCGEGSEMTYFAKAMFKESLLKHSSFEAAFEAAKELIVKWEDEDFPSSEHSEPQISMGSLIEKHLAKWRAQRENQ